MYLDHFRNAPKSDVKVINDSDGHFLIWQLNYKGGIWAYFQSPQDVESYLAEREREGDFNKDDYSAVPISVIKDEL